MHTQKPDAALEGLDDQTLGAELARNDWQNDPQFVPDEQVFRLFRRADAAGDGSRAGILARALGKRLLKHARGFAARSQIYPGIIGDLNQAAEELSQYIWECLVKRPGDASHAEKYLGQLFKRRALDFQRRLLAKKRIRQDSLDAMEQTEDDEDPERTIREVTGLRENITPEEALQRKQEHAKAVNKLQAVLTRNEYLTYVMLEVEEMRVKEVAAALQVSVKSINNYKNAALAKVRKEFNK
jgi:RNA polymerase sigma factor (sigma-70 family)